MSSTYIPSDAFAVEGEESLEVYQFGDEAMQHAFCRICGICPFSNVAKLPDDYEGRAKVGDRRVNLGCIDGLDVFALEITIIDGRSW